jgi:hypothetical protein
VLLPLGAAAAWWQRAWVLALAMPIWVLIYAGHFWFFSLYNIPAFAAVIVLVLAGAQTAAATWSRVREYLTVAIYGAIVGLSATTWPQLNRMAQDPTMRYMYQPTMADIERTLRQLPHQPAVVLFKFNPSWGVSLEPAYNPDVAWPDDAKVIRAHDLGERDAELFTYYSRIKPARAVYRFDEKDGRITYLGMVPELAKVLSRTK